MDEGLGITAIFSLTVPANLLLKRKVMSFELVLGAMVGGLIEALSREACRHRAVHRVQTSEALSLFEQQTADTLAQSVHRAVEGAR